MEESQNPKKHSTVTIVVVVVSAIIIFSLAFLFYYFSTKAFNIPVHESENLKPIAPKVVATNVITFSPPSPLPAAQKNGDCFSSSISALRTDAWRCSVGNSIFDPCFSTASKGIVYCQQGISASTGFLIKLTDPLPKAYIPQNLPNNWAWFLKLKDGTECSPFTGTRPFFSQNQIAYYGCKSANPNQQIVLLGDLVDGNVWTATEAFLSQNGTDGAWAIQSQKQVSIGTVWK